MNEPFLEEFLHKIDFCYLIEHNIKSLNEQLLSMENYKRYSTYELNNKFGHYFQEQELIQKN